MSRNRFENNEPDHNATHQELSEMSDGPYYELPPLAEGYHYQLVQTSLGANGVIIKSLQ